MRAREFVSEKEKLDEILPLITGAASLAGGAMSLAGGAASLAGGVASGLGSVAKGVGKGVGAVAGAAGSALGKTIGALAPGDKKIDPQQAQDIDRAKDQLLRPGKKIKLPTQGPGGPQDFEVTKVTGDEVEIKNPEGAKSPNQPNKLVYNKDDIKKTINI
jgi:hypothetical protein